MIRSFVCLISALLLGCPLYGQLKVSLPDDNARKIQVALLLDVSSSMEGLLVQARSQFWNVVNHIDRFSCEGVKPVVEFALISYGEEAATSNETIILQTNLTSELDSVASRLQDLETTGSQELCWKAISIALNDLTWSTNKKDLRFIVIAGNEMFDETGADVPAIVKKAKRKGILINTIYCGKKDNVYYSWENAAKLGRGKSSVIDINDTTLAKETGMDFKIREFNDKLNSTYLPYGKSGGTRYARLLKQDEFAQMRGIPFIRERIAYKISDSFRNNSWDIVDAFSSDSTFLEDIPFDELPAELKSLDLRQRKKYVTDLTVHRDNYKTIIALRYERIQKYLGETKEDTIDKSIRDVIDAEGKKKGFTFRN